MNEIATRYQNEIQNWNYDQAASELRNEYTAWNHMGVNIIRKLDLAHEILSERGAGKIERTNVRSNQTWTSFLDQVGILERTARRWLDKWKLIQEQQIEVTDDMNFRDIKVEKKIIPDVNPLQTILNEETEKSSRLQEALKTANEGLDFKKKEIEKLREKEKTLEEIENYRKTANDEVNRLKEGVLELTKRQADLTSDSESVKILVDILVKSRKFFTTECLQLPLLHFTDNSKKMIRNDIQGLLNLVDGWSEAIRQNILN